MQRLAMRTGRMVVASAQRRVAAGGSMGAGAAAMRAPAAGGLALGVAFLSTRTQTAQAAAGAATPASSPTPSPSSHVHVPTPADAAPFDLTPFKGFSSLESFKLGQDIVLYQYETCPFCNKVRAYLDYSGIRYRTVEVNPLTKAEKKAAGAQVAATKEVPVLVVNGHVLTDSTTIIKHLNEIQNIYRTQKEKHVIEEEEKASLAFVDQRIVILTAPNIYRTWRESVDSFDYIARNSQLSANSGAVTQFATKYVGAAVMYALAEKKLKKKYNITDPRRMLYTALDEWIGGNKGKQFRGGNEPNLADVTCFGVMRALQGYETGKDIMNPYNTSTQFVKWYKDMEQRVEAEAAAAKKA